MSDRDLKRYLLTYRHDQEAFYAYMDDGILGFGKKQSHLTIPIGKIRLYKPFKNSWEAIAYGTLRDRSSN